MVTLFFNRPTICSIQIYQGSDCYAPCHVRFKLMNTMQHYVFLTLSVKNQSLNQKQNVCSVHMVDLSHVQSLRLE